MQRLENIQGQIQPSKADLEQVRKDVLQILTNPNHDDGSIGPILVRLAWHASGTYCKETKTGGSNGSTMRYKKEKSDPANAGLHKAQEFLEPIKQKHPNISYADLWVLASYVAVEALGGPRIPFVSGRVDERDESKVPPNGRLPDASQGARHVRDIFGRMGFNDQEMVALIGGGHAIGRCHKDRSGYHGPWTFTPTKMSNQFFKLLLDNEWTPKQWDGPLQYEDKTKKLMMLPTDLEFKTDKEFRKYSEQYKTDKTKFLQDFSESFKKLTELGFVRF